MMMALWLGVRIGLQFRFELTLLIRIDTSFNFLKFRCEKNPDSSDIQIAKQVRFLNF